ncbi:cobaltochelatase CobN subunit [Kushneria avicenniae]|uniref:Cobaltochelatase subunit CobN n=1 Tax=Kushneria avicenniae TaxID=402385 RepID=A0A1I1FPB0_9GAMM|nr:cobaltochelatase subunit CobN [Kushneria avicenniae]SFC01379.1 cobaltochelatase CobN subunit [Kushneria avicenniae]
MHLFAAQPGGFSDDNGIVDLGQSPAELVILSAADSVLALLATVIEAEETERLTSVRLANWMNLLKPAAFDLYRDRVLDQRGAEAPRGARVVVLSLLGGASYWRYGLEQLTEWAQREGRTLIVVPGEDVEDDSLLRAGTVSYQDAHRVWRYLREGGPDNTRAMLDWLEDRFLQRPRVFREPRPLPRVVLHAPPCEESACPGRVTLADWRARWQPESPVAALVFYRSHLQQGNTGVFDALIEILESGGFNVLPVAVASLKERLCLDTLDELIEQSDASIMLNTTGFALAGGSEAAQTGYQHPWTRHIPILQLIMVGTTLEDWQGQTMGLRPRDIAMQVALPELDGRIITRPIAFKSAHYYSTRCQHDIVIHALHEERARFVAELARRWVRLSEKANRDKRVALVLANYPSSDARIGNGVGLDTPASTLNILLQLRDTGYPVSDALPHDPTALIEWLTQTVTNDAEHRDSRPAAQSLSLGEYEQYFSQLPQACQQAVLDRWGAPTNDPLHRHGRLMIAGMRLGETFVGVQPARGFDIDQNAAYHDPDLPPTHGYLAFYFWLRHVYGVDAFVHVGKHGNLEWLPGKGTALSDACWPDIVLGPMPHLYPFIVNDPGEGAQAKRRTQAVIIDHLMPPMTRAGIHDDLAELERLTDEYYQALGLDQRREQFLREAIIERVRNTHVLEELSLSPSAAEGTRPTVDEALKDDQVLLDALDNYLCDIKEAQIRDGLHVLGKLPDHDALRDTLMALVRLSRGSQPHEQSLLQAMAVDLGLFDVHDNFDLLAADAWPWQGPWPERLMAIEATGWRSSSHTRERLELLGARLIEQHLLTSDAARLCDQEWPQTRAVIDFMQETLLPVLHQSVDNELSALMDGLSGRFVPPGASGAPSRGRLDTLPTGRNFYSVDSRAMPTRTAWTLGQKSAEALIMRHLQEHGDYPTSLGLSVWGTATMRTGGDDIAQAFALMGIRPIWASGSQRVIDFEVIPGFLLGRPRVDVTLRVSGFFRDAFPGLIALYDSAVQKLVDLNEPGNGNTIATNVSERCQALRAEGFDDATARRQAGFRIFGARPGTFGAGVQKLLDNGHWQEEADLARAYVNWGGYAYGKNVEGEPAMEAFQKRLSTLEGIVQNQDNREHDLLDSGDYSQFQGGMSAAAHQQGARPALYFGDHANPASPRMRTLKEELNRVMRSRVTNPKWISAMQRHGYKGAFEMAASVDYLFAWDATTALVSDYQYEQISEALVLNEDNQRFLNDHNPQALKEMGETLMEAISRGLWQSPAAYQARLRDLLLSIDEQEERAS